MNIQIIAQNLHYTIIGKELYLAEEKLKCKSNDPCVQRVASVIVKMLELNIDELKRILKDVEECK